MGVVISVIIPIHNAEVELDRCLKSVLEQDININYEVLCIFDASNVKTYKIIDQYKKEYPRKLKILETEFYDPGEVRNFGIEHSEGEYIYFIDGDDFIEKDALKELYIKSKRSKADIVIGNYYTYYPKTNKRRSGSFFRTFLKQKSYNSKQIAYKVIKDFRLRGFVWNILFKKEFLIKNNIRFIPTKLAIEDRPFLVEACLCANKVYISNSKKYYYVQHNESYVKSSNRLIFMQKALNCNFVIKIILIHYNQYNEKIFKKLLNFNMRGIFNEGRKLASKSKKKQHAILEELRRQKLVITGDDLYVYNAPWEKAVLSLNFDEKYYKKLPASFSIIDLKKYL